MQIFATVRASLLLGLLIISAGTAWAQTAPDRALSGPAALYRRAASMVDLAQQKLNAQQLGEAKALVKEANSLFTQLEKECAPLLAERAITPKEAQQIAINQQLGDEAQSQGDLLMASAGAKENQAWEIESKGRKDAAQELAMQAAKEYEQAQNLFTKAGIYALRNRQIIFQFLTP